MPGQTDSPSELTQTSIDVDKLSQLLAQAHAAGLIRPTEENNTLVQKGAIPVTSEKEKHAAMQKYLKIAR